MTEFTGQRAGGLEGLKSASSSSSAHLRIPSPLGPERYQEYRTTRSTPQGNVVTQLNAVTRDAKHSELLP